MIAACLAHPMRLSPWEEAFVGALERQLVAGTPLSTLYLNVLRELYGKVNLSVAQ